jgi:hypothetical protein
MIGESLRPEGIRPRTLTESAGRESFRRPGTYNDVRSDKASVVRNGRQGNDPIDRFQGGALLMNRTSISLTVLLSLALAVFSRARADSGRLYGRVSTEQDDVFQGTIRWDDHETFWDDILDAAKEIDSYADSRERSRRKEIEIFGLTISWTETGDGDDQDRRFGIRLGRLRSIQRRSRRSAVLTLKDGTRMRVSDSGTDIGSSNRGIVIDDRDVGLVTVDWSDLEAVEFAPQAPGAGNGREEWRLYGTVTIWDGTSFRGFIRWDDDECLSTDILDGESRGEDLEIPFSKIKAIERASSSSARVELASGQTIRLRGTNDVDDGNRGIVVKVPDLGQVTVEWEDFERAEFDRPPPDMIRGYDDFDAGGPLYGTVWDDDGDSWHGRIRWDDDETMTYEFLDGKMDDVDVRIEFADIRSISRRSGRSAVVELNDGRTVTLRGTCDVDDENRGIFVEDEDGRLIRLDWYEFDRAVFERP